MLELDTLLTGFEKAGKLQELLDGLKAVSTASEEGNRILAGIAVSMRDTMAWTRESAEAQEKQARYTKRLAVAAENILASLRDEGEPATFSLIRRPKSDTTDEDSDEERDKSGSEEEREETMQDEGEVEPHESGKRAHGDEDEGEEESPRKKVKFGGGKV